MTYEPVDEPIHHIVVDFYGESVRVRSMATGTVMQATLPEWLQFIDEVKEGRWDYVPEQEIFT